MRRRKTGYILLALLVITGLAGSFHSSLSTKERLAGVSYLEETKKMFLKSVDGLSEAQLDFRPAPDEWSIRQCVEHIALTETKISGMISANLLQPADPSQRHEVIIKDEEVIQVITDPSQNITTPAFLQPVTAGIQNEGDELVQFKTLRNKNINFLKITTADMRNHFLQYPSLGVMDNYQFLLMMAAHTRRYTMQIEKIKSSVDFPE